MKKVTFALLTGAICIPLFAAAADPVIPWADNTGGTESTHIAGMGQDLNAQHQAITKTQEGVWAEHTGSIKEDEQALSSTAPPFQGYPKLMPHQG